MHSLIVFASGTGTNTRAIIDYFKDNGKAKVALIVTNNPEAGVINIALKEEIPFLVINKTSIKSPLIVEQLNEFHPSLIVLAGFMWKIPQMIIEAFPSRIINIHPALLPAYGGQGMYGSYVHQAVMAAGEKESGITVHYVNERYDEGNIILQARCTIHTMDSISHLENSVHALEHYYYPRVIEFLLNKSENPVND